MATLPIDATPGGAESNSYATLAEATLYHASHPYASTWDAATVDQQTRALLTATRLLDEHVDWKGYISELTQALQWPRMYMSTDRRALRYSLGAQPFDWWNAVYIDPTIIPDRLKQATAEFARLLLNSDRTAEDDLSRKQITGIRAGSVDITMKGYTQPEVVPDSVYYMVRHWGDIRHRAGMSVPLRRS